MLGKKIVSIIAAMALAVSLCPGAALASELEAGGVIGQAVSAGSAQKAKTLKQRGAKFDLKNGKTVSTNVTYKGAGKLKYTVKMSGLKVADAEELGYKKATFTLTYKQKKAMTKKQAKKVLKAYKKECSTNGSAASVVWDEWFDGHIYWYVVDSVTGKNLEDPDNAAGVTVEAEESKSGNKKYSGGGYSFTLPKTTKYKVTITYPEGYENLCVGVGGGVPYIDSAYPKADSSFRGSKGYPVKSKRAVGYTYKYDAKPFSVAYWQTSYFKKLKKNFHFASIS